MATMADNSFENIIMQSIKIACISSLRDDGLISDRQFDELLGRIDEMNSKAAEKQRESGKTVFIIRSFRKISGQKNR